MTEAITGWLTPGTDAIIWWLTIELIGLVAFPIGFLFFRFLPDRGYSFSKVLGLLLMSYLLWIGAMAHIIPNARLSIVLILAVLAIVSLVLSISCRREILRFLQDRWRHVLVIETFFTVAFFVGVYLKSYDPDFSRANKPMEMAFINGILRSEYFPPNDPWLSGHSISYYYFGHLNVAALTKLVAIPSGITYNLSVALFAALAATAAFGLVYNLVAGEGAAKRALLFGALGGLFLVFWGNLVGVFEMLAIHGVGSDGFYDLVDISGRSGIVDDLAGARSSSEWYPTESLWIHRSAFFASGVDDRQFPFYTSLLGKLRGGAPLALPFVLMTLALALNLWRSPHSLGWRFWQRRVWLLVLSSLVVGVLGFVHPWDLPTFLFIVFIVVALRNWVTHRRLPLAALGNTFAFFVPLALLSIVAYLPYYLTIEHPSLTIIPLEVATRPASVELGSVITKPHHLLYMWLPFLWLVGSFAIISLRWHRRFLAGFVALIPGLVLLASWCVLLILDRGPQGLATEIAERGPNWITILVLMALLTLVSLAIARKVIATEQPDDHEGTLYVLAIAGSAILLLLGIELFVVDDPNPFAKAIGPRFNTVFKSGFQAWVLLSISGAFALYYVASVWQGKGLVSYAGRLSWGVITGVILLAALAFPVSATFWLTNGFTTSSRPPIGFAPKPLYARTLDGFALFRLNAPAEYEAFEWLSANEKGAPVILEAPGIDLRRVGLISTYIGLPTVLGWTHHEAHWRGSYDPQAGRQEAVDRIYTTRDPGEARSLLSQFDVEYVYVGGLERERYGEIDLAKFDSFMDVVFRNEAVTIYKMEVMETVFSGGGP